MAKYPAPVPPTATTSLLALLQMGATVSFPGGRSMRGRPQLGYVEIYNEFGSEGLWDLDNAAGIESAVADLVRDAAREGVTLYGDALETAEE